MADSDIFHQNWIVSTTYQTKYPSLCIIIVLFPVLNNLIIWLFLHSQVRRGLLARLVTSVLFAATTSRNTLKPTPIKTPRKTRVAERVNWAKVIALQSGVQKHQSVLYRLIKMEVVNPIDIAERMDWIWLIELLLWVAVDRTVEVHFTCRHTYTII